MGKYLFGAIVILLVLWGAYYVMNSLPVKAVSEAGSAAKTVNSMPAMPEK